MVLVGGMCEHAAEVLRSLQDRVADFISLPRMSANAEIRGYWLRTLRVQGGRFVRAAANTKPLAVGEPYQPPRAGVRFHVHAARTG
jgi:hypothetical protein